MGDGLNGTVLEAGNAPTSLEDVLNDLQGFGVEDYEEILTIEFAAKSVRLRLSNMPTEDELTSILAVEGTKGYAFFQSVKLEILSRSISWINGTSIRELKGVSRLVIDPKDGEKRDIQVVLRNILKTWGLEVVQVLWKVLMAHSQRIEDRLVESFPDAATLTEVERRYRDRIEREYDEAMRRTIQEQVTEILADDAPDEKVPVLPE
jgi:hypothetical protein